jgi:hypothetical protein
LASPEWRQTQQKGIGTDLQVGLEYNGLGTYKSSEEISSDDLQYLFGLLQTYLFLQNVVIVPPSEAEVDVYIIVDVFGTVRTRVDWFLANNEILKAKSALEIMAVNHKTGELLMPPQTASSEAEYNEQYILWAGPVFIKKTVKPSGPLLCDFTDLYTRQPIETSEQDGEVSYPFRYYIEKWMGSEE